MAYFPQASPPTPCAPLYSPPYAPHALPISFPRRIELIKNITCINLGRIYIIEVLRYMPQDAKNMSSDISHFKFVFVSTLFAFVKSFKPSVMQICLTILVIFMYECKVIRVVQSASLNKLYVFVPAKCFIRRIP